MFQLTGTGNCNFAYLNYLRNYSLNNMVQVLIDLTTIKPQSFIKTARFQRIPYGILLFAQGSEDSMETNHYAAKFAEVLKKYKLGKVSYSGVVPNPAHNNKPASLYMWNVDHAAVKAWWEQHVDATGKLKPTNKIRERATNGRFIGKASKNPL